MSSRKGKVATELQASYNAKLPGLYLQPYEFGYWHGFTEAERLIGGVRDSPIEDVVEPIHGAEKDIA